MKTVLFHQHGGPEVLEYTDFPTPEPKPGEALIRLRAAALNRMDVLVRNGWPGLKLEMPHINGADGAGEIVALSGAIAQTKRRFLENTTSRLRDANERRHSARREVMSGLIVNSQISPLPKNDMNVVVP